MLMKLKLFIIQYTYHIYTLNNKRYQQILLGLIILKTLLFSE